jgi:hypothetical protein
MNASSILLLVIVVIAILFGSVFLGMAVGTSDFETLAGFAIIVSALATFAILRDKIWLLIPIFASWDGRIYLLPLPLSVANIAVAFVVGCSALVILTRSSRWRYKPDTLDFWLFCILAILALGYLRNPVGVAALASGGDIGARPYFEVGMAFLAYLILANKSATPGTLRRLPIMVVTGSALIAIGGTIAFFVPQVGIYMFQFYSGFLPNMSALDSVQSPDSSDAIGRAGFVLGFTYSLSLYLFARRPPLLTLSPTRPLELLGVMLVGVLALVSGFRGAVAAVGMYFIAGSYLWWRGLGLLVCVITAILAIFGFYAIQATFGLPDRIQRPLSFLPGPWDDHVVRSAKVSNEWRFDMWDQVLNGDSIKNRWIGDGFGFPASEFAYYSDLQQLGTISSQQLADYYLITGDLHSGPLSTLKFAGGIGLAVFTILSILVAVRYVRLWRRIRHTPLSMPIAFYSMAAIYFPIKFLFIFGAFQYELSYLIIMAGLLRLLEHSAADYEATQASVPLPEPQQSQQNPPAAPHRHQPKPEPLPA